jgi:hypothetical protein
MPKYVCSSDNKDAWNLPPGEASKQTFTKEEDAEKWFENEYPGYKVTFSGYTFDGDHSENEVFANGESVGSIAKYTN